MLEINYLTKKIKGKIILDNLSVSLDKGVYGLLGPNGAGKTTLMRCITNLYSYKGEILYQGEKTKGNIRFIDNVGYLPQSFGGYKELSVEENLRFFCDMKRIKKQNVEMEISKVLEKVNLIEEKNKLVKHLSGGMIRRLGIAQAIIGNPQIIILDEPTAGLDPEERLRFKMILSSLSDEKIIIISTHIVEDVDSLCNKIIVMDKGKVEFNDLSKKLKELAKNKIYECDESQLINIKGEYYLEKRYEKKDKVKYRFISTKEQDFEMKEATLEDGYICILKNM